MRRRRRVVGTANVSEALSLFPGFSVHSLRTAVADFRPLQSGPFIVTRSRFAGREGGYIKELWIETDEDIVREMLDRADAGDDPETIAAVVTTTPAVVREALAHRTRVELEHRSRRQRAGRRK